MKPIAIFAYNFEISFWLRIEFVHRHLFFFFSAMIPFMRCSNLFGKNGLLMGGCAGIATAIAMAVEYQKEMAPHGHGVVAVSNVYFHNTLPQIAELLDKNIRDTRHDLVNRIQQYMNHVQRPSHCVVETHNKNLDDIEQLTLAGKDEGLNPDFKWISFQPNFFSSTTMPGPEWIRRYQALTTRISILSTSLALVR